jgi:hypothetical protein
MLACGSSGVEATGLPTVHTAVWLVGQVCNLPAHLSDIILDLIYQPDHLNYFNFSAKFLQKRALFMKKTPLSVAKLNFSSPLNDLIHMYCNHEILLEFLPFILYSI